MNEDFLTPAAEERGHPILALMEHYTAELEKNDYLNQYGQTNHPLQAMGPVKGAKLKGPARPTYVGSEACKKCHEHAHDIWKKSGHAHAYKTLEHAPNPPPPPNHPH